ncbi:MULTISPECIES: hypothetical protein [Sphingobacterium]|uniref:Uncharacterized protein n=1 Tax=Sphingobacterium anhuiense TaxID=493780 RepID=A0ABW5YY90_9SPHI|nr:MULTISPECIES: hypothetical protein [Sphingobacterium]MCS3557374.1 hypothetical protein [Sphingobacterium sp. JUb21]MCW2259638.1 hypothetical protein [Sphingobacterium kitahiroshimense]QQD12285.1 hypothetical protein JAZ75_16950 [Sphingobacterium sp. UDSM-2020]TCR13923.1 hypothetical protein EDF67_10126 [Sphingobacterium sp. JUb78]
MKKQEIKKQVIITSVSQMIADKEAVRSYMKGKTTLQELDKKGIKFAKPL